MTGSEQELDPGASSRGLRVLHVSPDLAQGGAERVLWQIASTKVPGITHQLLVMRDSVFFSRDGLDITSLGFDLDCSGKAAIQLLPAVREINRVIEREQPDIVQGWLYYGALLVSLASRRVPTIWTIHNTTLPSVRHKPLLRGANWLLASLSARTPERIVYCAEAARAVHESAGYAVSKGIVIENGVDTTVFRADADDRRAMRVALGIHDTTPVVGLFCRWDAQKNIPGCLDAFEVARREIPEMVLVIAGRGMEATNSELVQAIVQRGLTSSCRILGPVKDMEMVIRGTDVVMLGSVYGEAMPMILLEALASSVAIAATRIGDVSHLDVPDDALADFQNSRQLADALLFSCRTVRSAAWCKAFHKARNHYTLERCISHHTRLYETISGRCVRKLELGP